jgi:Phosphotransferase enzyme family
VTKAGSIEQRALAAASAVAGEHGVPCEGAAVINAGSNVLVHLRPSPVVARVMTGTVVLHGDPERWLSHEVSVLGFLAPTGLAVAPSPFIPGGPYERDGLWMTFCDWVDLRGQTEPRDPERLGGALWDLHEALSGFSGGLPGFADLGRDIERLLGLLRPTPDLGAEKIESLEARLHALDETVFQAAWPEQALHGDASLYNLLHTKSGHFIWNDFEDTFRGPVHWDLAGYLISLEARGADAAFVAGALDAYGGIDGGELEPFTAAHHVYDEIWRAYDAQRRS